jgi:glycosyltransferase involved in cell wall biosynthesis
MTLRILHVIDTGGPGGAETVLKEIVRGLPEANFLSRIIVPSKNWLYYQLTELKFDVVVIPRNRSPDIWFLWALINQIYKFSPDVIHCHLLTSSVYASVATSIFRQLPIIVTFHGLPDINGKKSTLYLKGRILSRSRNKLVFVAQHLCTSIKSLLQLPDSICHVIYNGISFDRTECGNAKISHPENANHIISIGTVGNIRPAKDYPTLLKTAAIVCKLYPDVKFIIAGDGSENNLRALKATRDEYGITNNVEFKGFISDISNFISSLDIFLSCSNTEGLPLAILEAAGSGCPIVATECGGNEEILHGKARKYLAPIQAPEEIALKLITLINNLDSAKKDAIELSYDVRKQFDVSLMINQYVEIYKQAIENV